MTYSVLMDVASQRQHELAGRARVRRGATLSAATRRTFRTRRGRA
jgi:hypothetical protein